MRDQEQFHLDTFERLIHERRVRPTALSPLWNFGAHAMGVVTGLLGKEAAMACTEAVEGKINIYLSTYSLPFRSYIRTL